MAFVSVAAVSLFMAGTAYMAAEESARIKFEAAADEAISRIELRAEQHMSLLRASLAFFEARGGAVTAREFRTFVDGLEIRSRNPGIRSIGYASVILPGNEGEISRLLASGYDVQVSVWPDSDADIRTPVTHLAPLDESNRGALGYDMYSEPVRRAAIDEAISFGEARATERINLVASAGSQSYPGFIVYLPVVGPSEAPRLVGLTQQPVRGLLYASFRAADLFNTALIAGPLLPVHMVVGGPEAEGARILYQSNNTPDTSLSGRPAIQRQVSIAGRQWPVEMRPTEAFEAPASKVVPITLGLFGLLLATALAYMARLQDRAYDAIAKLHAQSEHSLQEKDLMLQEMKHRIKNSIARVLAIARQTAARSASIEEFSDSFGSRLQSMAASQDMLTRSRWQTADLQELLRTELEQVFGRNFEEGILRGPRVQIDETTTQALGLTFHELATNALKYGAFGTGKGALKVEWRVDGKRSERKLILSWIETGDRPVTAPEKAGFGTRLIEMNVVRELNGSIIRDYRDDGMSVRIQIPLRQAARPKAEA